jgi:hypothetical protein
MDHMETESTLQAKEETFDRNGDSRIHSSDRATSNKRKFVKPKNIMATKFCPNNAPMKE